MQNLTKSQSIKVVMALMVGYSCVYMDKNMISTAVIPIATQFKLAPTQTGLIMSAFFLGYSLMQIPGGWLADKIGAKKVLMISLGLISLFSFLFGMVSMLMLFMLIRFFAGVGHGGYPASCSKSVAKNFRKEDRTLIQSLILSTSGIGGILAFAIGSNIIAINWRYAYLFLGTLFFIALVLVACFVPADTLAKQAQEEHITYTSRSFKSIITDKNVVILFVTMLFLNITFYGSMSWLPTYLTQTYHLNIQSAGYILTANSLAQVFGTIVTGYLLTKYFLGKEKSYILGIAIVMAVLIIGLITINNLIISAILVVLIGTLSVASFCTVFTWPHKLFHEEQIGSVIGIVNTGGTLGGFIAPMLLGALIELNDGSFTLAFGFLAVAIVAAGILAGFVQNHK